MQLIIATSALEKRIESLEATMATHSELIAKQAALIKFYEEQSPWECYPIVHIVYIRDLLKNTIVPNNLLYLMKLIVLTLLGIYPRGLHFH